ncbi:hypothetical protein FAF44_02980 [Nonomuraea sp. MG754425]|uniref:hypothetical protein n=1 Tax=Nonomuraea sp. MG754425 TaxID=2570319 RepID=UPI001F342D28|nr:hypothetical protein [Nonomuraea sp. MG754425]MCF6467379.1 hypothetical protein [Nonomuraea sp. MG754425]
MTTFKIQQEVLANHELPKPFFADESGAIGRQDVWKGNPAQVIGFQYDPDLPEIDLLWDDAIQDPDQASGMYLVTADADGNFSTHTILVESLTVVTPAGGESR